MAEPVIDRDETIALLFNIADMARVLRKLGELLFPEDDDGEDEVDEG